MSLWRCGKCLRIHKNWVKECCGGDYYDQTFLLLDDSFVDLLYAEQRLSDKNEFISKLVKIVEDKETLIEKMKSAENCYNGVGKGYETYCELKNINRPRCKDCKDWRFCDKA